jgi:CubicO group peptidase (beta-lactamase class C family)
VAMSDDGLPRLHAEIQRGFERRLQRGFQVCISLSGQVIADFAVGETRPGQPMTIDTINRWLSSGKPITAVALAILNEQGLLDWDDPVSHHLPEFPHQKITIRHLLIHTSGLPKVEIDWPDDDWLQIIQGVVKMAPAYSAGDRAEYQPGATWFLLGEIISRVSGSPFSDFVRHSICEPLEMYDSWNGMTVSTWADYGDRIGMMWARRRAKLVPLPSHGQASCCAPSPGANFRGPIRELTRFYEMLLGQGTRGDVTILQPNSVRRLTGRHRVAMHDQTFQHRLDFGLGFMVDSNRYGRETVPYGFGRYSSPAAYGHGGAESSCAFADPVYDLIVAWVANVRAGEGRHQTRNRAINSAIYEDLGFTARPD